MTNGLTDEAIAAYAAELLDIEADIEARQDDKKAVYGNIREAYGKRSADALKLAIKRHRMESDKLAAAEELDAEAERFLGVIRSPRAPRATRVREIIEEFPAHDPETGEVAETSSQPTDAGLACPEISEPLSPSAGTGGEAGRHPIQPETVEGKSEVAEAAAAGESPADHRLMAVSIHGGEDVAPSPAHAPEQPGTEDSSVRTPAEGGANSATISAFTRTHNPATHFLNSEGRERLHGCLKPDMCGSQRPHGELCWSCAVRKPTGEAA